MFAGAYDGFGLARQHAGRDHDRPAVCGTWTYRALLGGRTRAATFITVFVRLSCMSANSCPDVSRSSGRSVEEVTLVQSKLAISSSLCLDFVSNVARSSAICVDFARGRNCSEGGVSAVGFLDAAMSVGGE